MGRFGDGPLIPHGPDGVVLADRRGEPALGGDAGDPAEYGFVLVL
jgi:hypothetical protein